MSNNVSMDSKFNKFMNKHKVLDDGPITHTSMGEPFGKYNISDDELDKFYELYCGNLLEGTHMHILEVHKECGPVIIDLDFKQDIDDIDRYYDMDDIHNFIKLYNKQIIKYVDASKNIINAYIFEKDSPIKNETKKRVDDGIHIMYPELCIRYEIQHLIREEMIKKMEKYNLFVNDNYMNSLQSIYDKSVINSTNWLLYGSHKPQSIPYKLTNILSFNLEKRDLTNYDITTLPRLLSIRNFDTSDQLYLNDNLDKAELVSRLDKLGGVTKKDKEKNINNLIQEEVIGNIKKYSSEEDVLIATKLVELLNVNRAEDYNEWIRVGWCLHNIDDSLLNSWITFSKQNPKFKKGECEKMWKKFKNEGFGIGTLFYWAKMDNIDGYLAFFKEKIDMHIKQSVNGTPYDIAIVMHALYRNEYKCVSLPYKLWYEYKNHRWNAIDEGYTLQAKISVDIINEYAKMNAQIYLEISETTDSDKKESLLKKVEMMHKIINKLKTTSFKKDVMTECRHLFYDNEFLNVLDENRNLLCFTNGIYDLEQMVFRDGSPDDCVSLCTNIAYKEYDEEGRYIKEVYNFFKQIQPVTHIMNYVLSLLSSYLQGHTPDEKFHIVTGTGANGKSKMIELVQLAMGDYAGSLPVALITQKRAKAGVASPEMANTKGKRFLVFSEPEETDKIQVGLMKELTGGDKITARALFKAPIEFKPQFKLLLACNKLPHIPATDQGTWRRVRAVEFGSKFVKEPNPKNKNEYAKDEYLNQRFEEWKVALMSILIYKFKEYKENGLIEPAEITKFTKKYETESDVYAEYLDEVVVQTGKGTDMVTINAMFDSFKTWIRSSYTDRKAPGRKEFIECITPKIGEKNIKGLKVYGLVFAENVEVETSYLDN